MKAKLHVVCVFVELKMKYSPSFPQIQGLFQQAKQLGRLSVVY